MKKHRRSNIALLGAALLIVAVLAAGCVGVIVLPAQDLQAADALVSRGAYPQAVEAYQALSERTLLGVKLSDLPFGPAHEALERIPQTQYRHAEALLEIGSYDKASAQFKALGDYQDAAGRVGEPYYVQAEALLTAGEFAQAADAFHRAGAWRDASERIGQAWYGQAEALLAEGQYEWASDAFFSAGDYADAAERIDEPFYVQGETLLSAGRFDEAAAAFQRAGGYRDASSAAAYSQGRALMEAGQYDQATEALRNAGAYRDAAALAAQAQQAAEAAADRSAVLAPYTTPGNIVTLGSWEQDGVADNGREPLRWIVVEAGEGYSLLVSERIIAHQPYTDLFVLTTWENSALRAWLLDSFVPAAFSEQERALIISLPQLLQAASRHGVVYDPTNSDLATMLDEHQVRQLLSGGAAQATAEAIRQGVTAQEDGYARYWLCMPDYDADDAQVVSFDGTIDSRGVAVNTEGVGVRPAIYLNHSAIQ